MGQAAGNLVAQAHSVSGRALGGRIETAFRASLEVAEAATSSTAEVWSKTNSVGGPSDLSESPPSTSGSH